MHDVLVIGGGPVGSYIARCLAGAGFGVAVLERGEKSGGRVCCTGMVSPECLREFGIDDSLVINRFGSARIFSPSGNILRISREKEQACVIDRAGLNLSFAGNAISAGAEYFYSSRVNGIRVEKGRVAAAVYGKGEYHARAAVIAAGFESALLKNSGFDRARDFAIGAQAEVETAGLEEVEVYLGNGVAPGFFGWLVPTVPGRALAGLMSRRGAAFYLKKLLDSLKSQGKIKAVTSGPVCRGITLRPGRRTYDRRVIIAGDAAGQVKPLTGGGLYYGLLSARIAARELERALKSDDLSARALSRYERDWKKRLGTEITTSYWARKLYEKIGDARIERAFDIIKGRGIDEALAKSDDLAFDWHSRAVIRLARHMVVPGIAGFIGLSLEKGLAKVKDG